MLILHRVILEVFYWGPCDAARLPIKTSGVTDGKMTAKTGGSGLGLAIVQQLCEIHDWKIELLMGKKQGLDVKLTIPLN
jgi:signal transduction histidine kinase